jgi:electron transfer flavoprotein beta subunit
MNAFLNFSARCSARDHRVLSRCVPSLLSAGCGEIFPARGIASRAFPYRQLAAGFPEASIDCLAITAITLLTIGADAICALCSARAGDIRRTTWGEAVNILVILRMIPDAASELQPTEDGKGLDREWLDFQLNDFDDHALEEAILIKEATGARVIAIAVGEGANRVLQMAAARGADEVTVLDAEEGVPTSSRDLAATVAAIARAKAADIVLCGVQSGEDVFGQLAPYVGALLDWPHVSGTSRVTAAGDRLTVSQERGAGVTLTYEVQLPAVIGVQTASKAPRYVSGSKLREASKVPVAHVALQPTAFPGSARLLELHAPSKGASGESLGEDPARVADRLMVILATKGFVKG